MAARFADLGWAHAKLNDHSLLELFNEGLITAEEAYVRSEQKSLMRQALMS